MSLVIAFLITAGPTITIVVTQVPLIGYFPEPWKLLSPCVLPISLLLSKLATIMTRTVAPLQLPPFPTTT